MIVYLNRESLKPHIVFLDCKSRKVSIDNTQNELLISEDYWRQAEKINEASKQIREAMATIHVTLSEVGEAFAMGNYAFIYLDSRQGEVEANVSIRALSTNEEIVRRLLGPLWDMYQAERSLSQWCR
jgi:hypothetical protein